MALVALCSVRCYAFEPILMFFWARMSPTPDKTPKIDFIGKIQRISGQNLVGWPGLFQVGQVFFQRNNGPSSSCHGHHGIVGRQQRDKKQSV